MITLSLTTFGAQLALSCRQKLDRSLASIAKLVALTCMNHPTGPFTHHMHDSVHEVQSRTSIRRLSANSKLFMSARLRCFRRSQLLSYRFQPKVPFAAAAKRTDCSRHQHASARLPHRPPRCHPPPLRSHFSKQFLFSDSTTCSTWHFKFGVHAHPATQLTVLACCTFGA